MNLTDPLKDLLRVLVSNHEVTSGKQFILVRSTAGYGLVYPGGISFPVENDDIDFRHLRKERLIDFIPVSVNQWRGKPTDYAIDLIRRGFHERRLMRDFESRCALLAQSAKEMLQERGAQWESRLSYLIEHAATTIRKRRARIELIAEEREKENAEAALLREIAALRRRVVEAAETVATEGVREFASGVLTSQGRLGVPAVLLRTYTARLVSGVRHWLNGSEVTQTEALLPWRQDSIAQKGIQTCEDVLAERERAEGGGLPDEEVEPDRTGQKDDGPRTWSPIVQEWEALKSIQRIESDEPERIPEGDLRAIVARHFAIEPEDVTDWHIELAAVDLCRHYERVQVIPSAISTVNSAATESQKTTPIPDADFWKEREEEFRRHDMEANKVLGATWFSGGEYWTFHAGSGSSASTKSIDCFRSLAREAAKGLRSQRGAEAWIDWLDWMRQAEDEETGKFLYAKNCPGSGVVSERERERMIAAGEAIPAGYLIEFIGTKDGGVERRMYWDTNMAIIGNIFENSANQCMKLRSLAPLRADDRRTALAPGAIRMDSASRFEIEKYANEIFRAGLEDRIVEYEQKQTLRPELEQSPMPARAEPEELGDGPEALSQGKTDPPIRNDRPKPTLGDVQAALADGNRKKAVKLRCEMDECTVKELWTEAFRQRFGKANTKLTALNRWRASRPDTPSWADELIQARLLK